MGKRSRHNAQVRPNERFYRVHEMIGRMGGMTFAMLHHFEWAGRKEQTCLDKLEQWERYGTLERIHREVEGKAVTLYVLTAKGRNMLPASVQPHLYHSSPTENETKHVLRFGEYLFSFGPQLPAFVNERELRVRNWQKDEADRDPEVTDGYVAGEYIEIDSGDSGVALREKCMGLQKSGKPTKFLVYSKARQRSVIQALRKAAATNVQVVLEEPQGS